MTRYTHPPLEPDRRRLVCTLREHEATWTGTTPIRRLLEVFETNPWGPIRQMNEDYETWLPYDRDAAVAAVWSGAQHSIGVRSGEDARVAASLALGRDHIAVVDVGSAALADQGAASVEAMIERIAAGMDEISLASAVADPSLIWIALRGHPRPPPPFTIAAWLQVLYPRAYQHFVTRDALLAAPVRVEERDRGAIWMWTYDDPLQYDRDEVVASMKQLAVYLHEHARPWLMV